MEKEYTNEEKQAIVDAWSNYMRDSMPTLATFNYDGLFNDSSISEERRDMVWKSAYEWYINERKKDEEKLLRELTEERELYIEQHLPEINTEFNVCDRVILKEDIYCNCGWTYSDGEYIIEKVSINEYGREYYVLKKDMGDGRFYRRGDVYITTGEEKNAIQKFVSETRENVTNEETINIIARMSEINPTLIDFDGFMNRGRYLNYRYVSLELIK